MESLSASRRRRNRNPREPFGSRPRFPAVPNRRSPIARRSRADPFANAARNTPGARLMIHYTCDLCKRPLAEGEDRSELTMRLAPAQPVADSRREFVEDAEDIDHLEALDDMLGQMDDDEA